MGKSVTVIFKVKKRESRNLQVSQPNLSPPENYGTCSEIGSRKQSPGDQEQEHRQIQRGDRATWVPQEGTSAPTPAASLETPRRGW